LKTIRIEPGYNVGVTRQNAYIDVEVYLIETGKKDNVLGKMEIKMIAGATPMGYDFDSGARISESYEKSGKILASFLLKNAFK